MTNQDVLQGMKLSTEVAEDGLRLIQLTIPDLKGDTFALLVKTDGTYFLSGTVGSFDNTVLWLTFHKLPSAPSSEQATPNTSVSG